MSDSDDNDKTDEVKEQLEDGETVGQSTDGNPGVVFTLGGGEGEESDSEVDEDGE